MSKRPSKAKRELRRKAELIAEQEKVLQKALQARHTEDTSLAYGRADRIKSGLGGVKGKALYGPRQWSPPEVVEVAGRSLGRIDMSSDKPAAVAEGVRPTWVASRPKRWSKTK